MLAIKDFFAYFMLADWGGRIARDLVTDSASHR